MSKHGRGSGYLKRGSKSRQSNDSLNDTDSNAVSGGMGERKTTSEESRQGFADDELESISHFGSTASHKSGSNRCNRCKVDLSTKARYCRKCYEDRENWMPLRPTRQKRRRTRNERHEDRCSMRRQAARSLDRVTDWDYLFNPMAGTRKGPKGEGMTLPGPMFSNLPQFSRRRKSSSSSISSAGFMKERRREWLKRRVYYRWADEGVEQMDWGEVLPRCLICKVSPTDTYIIHGSTAHACVCQRCAWSLLDRRGRCPQCNNLVTGISKKPQ